MVTDCFAIVVIALLKMSPKKQVYRRIVSVIAMEFLSEISIMTATPIYLSPDMVPIHYY